MKSEKKCKFLLLTFSLLLFTSAAQAELVAFRDYDANTGEFTNAVRECALVTSGTRMLTAGWWAVKGEVTIPEGSRLLVEGRAHLVLCDGATLKIEKPGTGKSAVNTAGSMLTIYGQTAGTGHLVAFGGPGDNMDFWREGAGIGGDAEGLSSAEMINGGTVTINGGTVTAMSDAYAAGIGGGYGGAGGIVTINGGIVTATSYMGIGIGAGGEFGKVTITGGAINAESMQGDIQISGGSIDAENIQGNIRISGGAINANGIQGGNINISDGSIDAESIQGDIQISGGAIKANSIQGGNINISGGIFKNEPQAGWLVPYYRVFENPDEVMKGEYPYAVIWADIHYLDWDEDQRKMTNAVVRAENWTEVTADTRTLLDGVWYVVRKEIVLPDNGNLTVEGSAHLILCDGATLKIENPGGNPAVKTTDASLTIYGQTAGTGCLTVQGGYQGAGIGSGYHSQSGTITINGGTVTAQGGSYGAGIGSGDYGAGGTVTINGGVVTANGGYDGAGIGGGYSNSVGGTVTINGGVVKAQGGGAGAGIGGGNGGAGGMVTINGGAIKAQGSDHAGGIGGGFQGSDAVVTISGGIFNIPIPARWCASHFAPVNNPDSATKGDYPYAVVPGWDVTIGAHPKTTVVWTSGDGTKKNKVEGWYFTVPYGTKNVAVSFTANPDFILDGEPVVDLGTVTEDVVFGDGNSYAEPRAYCTFGDIPYLDWNGSQMTNAVLSKYDYALVTTATEEMATGWYVAAGTVERGSIKVTGAVNLVVMDGCELKVSGGNDYAGIEVSEGDSLVIYGQASGTGKLTATGRGYGAGIGGGSDGAGGTVTINGGVVTATSAVGAGIGGGSLGAGGIVTINGGMVTAISSSWSGADIGCGGTTINNGAVTINGGAVTAGKIWGNDIIISGGIFVNEPQDDWIAPDSVKMENQDEATKAEYPWAVMPPCVVTVGSFSRGIVEWTSCDGSEMNVVEDGAFKVKWGTENVKVIFTANPGYELVGETVVALGTVMEDIKFGSGSGYKLPGVRTLPVKYVDADGVEREKAFGEFTRVSSSTKKFADGKWYAVIDDVTLANSITVEGTAHLILCDWATLTVANVGANAAIFVGSGASLTIYGQEANTGRLVASGGDAGIGGKSSGECGAVTIHGGTISASATVNNGAAGIGSGRSGRGGSVTITGGRITAQGGNGAEDIGSGFNAVSPCSVSISGGIFAREPDDNWLAPGYSAVLNEDEATKAAYPWTVEYHHPTYTIAYYDYGAWIDGFEPVTEYTIETETIALPDADDIASRMGGVFQGWTNEVGEVVSEVVQGTTGNLNFYAVWKSGAFIQIPVDSYEDLDERGKVALDAIMLEFGTPVAIKAWADAVYTDGKIPASKLNRSSPELIAIAKRYNIPVLTDGAVVETAQAADGAFTFKIVDEEMDVYLFAAKVENMIKYSADLGSFAVDTDKVSAQVQDERTIKAVFLKPNNETKGFMKLELPATEE